MIVWKTEEKPQDLVLVSSVEMMTWISWPLTFARISSMPVAVGVQ